LINESRKYPITSVTDAYTIAQQQIANNKIDVYQNKAFLEFLDKNYQEWASLPNSKNEFTDPKQRGRFNVVSIYNVYIEAVKKYPTGFYPGVDINKALKIFG